MNEQRRLAAIMFTDVVGFSALMSRDEKLTLQILDTNRKLHKDRILKYNGQYIKEIGDGTLSIFPSAWDAVCCAMDLQKTLISEGTYRLRIGIHIGDVVVEGNDVFGDGVNIAARIQGICDPGNVFISARILEDVKNKLETGATYIGEKLLKNIDHPVEIYALSGTEKKLSTDRSHRHIGKKDHFVYSKKKKISRLAKGFLFLLAGLVFAAVMIFLFRPGLIKAFTATDTTPIAVISFENQTGDTAFNFLQKAIPNLLITNLEQSKLFQVITWERMKDVIAQLGKKDVDIIDADLGFEICGEEGCQVIVTGSFVRAGDVFVTDVKVLDVTSKKILKSVSSKGNGIGSILDTQIDELSKAIARGAGISVLKVETTPMHIQDVTTNSLEAYNYYLKGLDAWGNAYWEDARQFFEKAVKIDPGFSMAYFYLSGSYYGLQKIQKGSEALEKAYKASVRATENEQLLIHAWYAYNIQKDNQKNLALLLELVEKAPRDKRVHFLLGLAYVYNNLLDKAIEQFLKAVDLDPGYGDAFNQLGYLFYRKGDITRAMDYLKRYAITNPNDANPFDTMGDLYFFMGKLDEAMEQYKQAFQNKPDFQGTAEKIAYIYAMKEDYTQANQWMENAQENAVSENIITNIYWSIAFMNYHYGKLDLAMQSLDKYVDMGTSQKIKYINVESDGLKAFIYYDLGQYEKAEKHYMASFNDLMEEVDTSYIEEIYHDYYFFIGLLNIRSRQMDSASNNIQRIKTISTDPAKDFNYQYILKEFQIASAQKRTDLDSITPETFQSRPGFAFPWFLYYNVPFQRNSLAEAYHRFGMQDKAIAEYERLITFDSSKKDRHLINPRYHYYLGMLYQEKGMKQKAAGQYRKFLDLWQDADPVFAEPADARKRLKQILD